GLKKLMLVYPFDEAGLQTLLDSERIRRLQALTLVLSIEGGQWDCGGSDGGHCNDYMKANVSRYESSISAGRLFDLAFGQASASVQNLSMTTRSFDLTRSADRVQHFDIRTEEAAYALAECNPRQPIEALSFDYDLRVDEPLATALAGADFLGRVYRLEI